MHNEYWNLKTWQFLLVNATVWHRYRICAMSNDIIVLEEILGYVLEALDIIEVR